MLAVKTVKQNIQPVPELESLLNIFKKMVNHCIHVGLEKNISSRFRLQNEVYRELHNGYHTWYILSAVEKGCAILKNYRKAKRKNVKTKTPYVTKAFVSIGNECYKIADKKLRLTVRPRQYVYLPLNSYSLKVLSQPSLKPGSITLTANTVSISFSKETVEVEPSGYIGIDRNLDNVTAVSGTGQVFQYDLSKATEIKSVYRTVKSHLKRNDVRIRKNIFGKYGVKERNRVNQLLNNVSKDVVEKAKENSFAVVMENLKGIRKLYQKGNGQGTYYRGRMNSWSYYELQRQIEYKARWEGLKVIYVDARGTSKLCSICGSELYPNGQRELWCPECSISIDRDINAARNILARGVRFTPNGLPKEAMVTESVKVIRKVDGRKLTNVPIG